MPNSNDSLFAVLLMGAPAAFIGLDAGADPGLAGTADTPASPALLQTMTLPACPAIGKSAIDDDDHAR